MGVIALLFMGIIYFICYPRLLTGVINIKCNGKLRLNIKQDC